MYIYIYIYMYICYALLSLSVYIYIYIVYMYMYVMYIYIYICIHVCVCVCVCVHIYIYIYICAADIWHSETSTLVVSIPKPLTYLDYLESSNMYYMIAIFGLFWIILIICYIFGILHMCITYIYIKHIIWIIYSWIIIYIYIYIYISIYIYIYTILYIWIILNNQVGRAPEQTERQTGRHIYIYINI